MNRGKEEWLTVAYIPVVRTEQESAAGERGRLRRSGTLQRVLYLTLRSSITASHDGGVFQNGDQSILFFQRLLMCLCNQPEDRYVLGLKNGQCAHPCSSCDVRLADLVNVQALESQDRAVIATLERQHEGFRLRRDGRSRSDRLALEAVDSSTSVLPAIASMTVLSTPPYLLFKIIGFDILHVRSGTPCLCYCSLVLIFCRFETANDNPTRSHFDMACSCLLSVIRCAFCF